MEAIALLQEADDELDAQASLDAVRPRSRGERLLSRLGHLDTFSVGGTTLRFSDDVWDFSELDLKPQDVSRKRLNFAKVGKFVDYAKLYCFSALLKSDYSVSTIRGDLYEVVSFLNAVEEAGYDDIASLPYAFFADRYAEPGVTSYVTLMSRRARIFGFLEFYEMHFGLLHDKRCMKLLRERDRGRLEAEKEAAKRDAIDGAYLEELLRTCRRVAADEREQLDNRIVACCLLMYSQIGHRTGEMGTFKAGAVSKVEGRERGHDLWYADFKYSKSRRACRWDLIPTTCYMNAIALDAFKMLERLCDADRKSIGSDALVVFAGGVPFTTSSFGYRYHRFIIDCLCRPPFLKNANRNRGMKAKRVADAIGGGWWGLKTDESINLAMEERGLSPEDVFVYPEIRMFRNTVCTALYERKVSLKWIQRHLNHLYVDMEAYYCRADREIDKAFSDEVYRAILTKGERAVGPHGDALMRKIHSFLEKKGFLSRIERDPDDVIDKLSRKYPLKKKRCGMCIRCAGIVPCAADGLADEILCAFGVCPNHCSMYWMAAGTYVELRDAEAVVEANLNRGRIKEAQHELMKLQRVLEGRFALEYSELAGAVELRGADAVVEEHPELFELVTRMEEIEEEIERWKSWTI